MRFLILIVLLLSSNFISLSQQTDPNFNPVVIKAGGMDDMVVQPDGKPLIFGSVTHVGTTPARRYVTRLNTDGTIDNTFQAPELADRQYTLKCLVQSDGKLVLRMNFSPFILRLNTDGSVDTSFPASTSSSKGPNNTVDGICALPDGKILLFGDFTSYNGIAVPKIARINSDGSLDTSFQPLAENVANEPPAFKGQSDGKILIASYVSGGNYVIRRLNADGSPDPTFNQNFSANSAIIDIEVLADNKFIIAGWFTTVNGQPRKGIAKFDANGNLDASFLYTTELGDFVYSATLDGDKIIVTGDFEGYDVVTTPGIARLNADGTLDATFISRGTKQIRHAAILSNGDMFITGSFTSYDGTDRLSLAKIDASGNLITGFQADIGWASGVDVMAPTPEGKVWIGGSFNRVNGTRVSGIALFNADGTLDPSFNSGTGFSGGEISSITIQADNKAILTGSFTSYNGSSAPYIVRINPDGTRDATFAPTFAGGTPHVVTCQQDGKIVVAGSFTSVNGTARKSFARMNADGTLDASFNSADALTGPAYALYQTSEGKFMVTQAGSDTTVLRRYTNMGAVDATFAAVSFNSYFPPMAIKEGADGKLYIGGPYSKVNNTTSIAIVRLNSNGTVDDGFRSPFVQLENSMRIASIGIIDDKILIGGRFSSLLGYNMLAALDQDGSFSPDYYIKIPSGEVSNVYVINDTILVNGTFIQINGQLRSGIARILVDKTLPQAPSNLRITANKEINITLAWDDNSSFESNFRIEYAIGTQSHYKPLTSTLPNVTSFKYWISELYAGETIYYRVAARAPGGSSPWSNVASAVILPIPVTKLSASALSSTQNKLTWQDNTNNENSIRVFRKSPTTSFSVIKDLSANVTTYTDEFTTVNERYVYKVENLTPDGYILSPIPVAPTQNGYWTELDEFPGDERQMGMCFVIGDDIYYGGGVASGGLKDFWQYSTATKVWTRKADFPGSADFGYATTAVGHLAFVIGGRTSGLADVNEVWMYNAGNNTWVSRQPLPDGPIYGASCFVADYKLFVVGGKGVINTSSKLWHYDISSNKWNERTDFPGAGRTYAVAFSVGINGYFGLGSTGATEVKDWWKYNAASEEWTQLADFPGNPRTFAHAVPFYNKGYVIGGSSGNTLLDDVWEFDVANSSWVQRTNLPAPLASGSLAATNFDVFAIGGQSTGGLRSNVLKFDPFIQAPAAPAALTASLATLNSIKLDWSVSTSFEDYFVVERSLNESTGYDSIAKVDHGQITFTDTGATLTDVTYYYRVVAVNRAGRAASSSASLVLTGIDDTRERAKVYPNPTAGTVSITHPRVMRSLIVLNVNGQKVLNELALESNRAEVNLAHVPDGIYIVQVNDGIGIVRLKVVKTR